MAERGRSVLDDDYAFEIYNKLDPKIKKIADQLADQGRSVLDDDSIYNQYKAIVPNEMRAQAKLDYNAEVAQQNLEAVEEFKKNNPIVSALAPRASEDVATGRPLDAVGVIRAIKDGTSLPGRAIVAGTNFMADRAAQLLNAPKERQFELAGESVKDVIKGMGETTGKTLPEAIVEDPYALPLMALGAPMARAFTKAGMPIGKAMWAPMGHSNDFIAPTAGIVNAVTRIGAEGGINAGIGAVERASDRDSTTNALSIKALAKDALIGSAIGAGGEVVAKTGKMAMETGKKMFGKSVLASLPPESQKELISELLVKDIEDQIADGNIKLTNSDNVMSEKAITRKELDRHNQYRAQGEGGKRIAIKAIGEELLPEVSASGVEQKLPLGIPFIKKGIVEAIRDNAGKEATRSASMVNNNINSVEDLYRKALEAQTNFDPTSWSGIRQSDNTPFKVLDNPLENYEFMPNIKNTGTDISKVAENVKETMLSKYGDKDPMFEAFAEAIGAGSGKVKVDYKPVSELNRAEMDVKSNIKALKFPESQQSGGNYASPKESIELANQFRRRAEETKDPVLSQYYIGLSRKIEQDLARKVEGSVISGRNKDVNGLFATEDLNEANIGALINEGVKRSPVTQGFSKPNVERAKTLIANPVNASIAVANPMGVLGVTAIKARLPSALIHSGSVAKNAQVQALPRALMASDKQNMQDRRDLTETEYRNLKAIEAIPESNRSEQQKAYYKRYSN
jgi:hypothetical protein